MILKMMEVGPIQVNCYIVGDEETGDAAVFDPGGHVSRILEVLTEDGLKVRYIVNTHAHWDHTGGNQQLQEATGAPILIHRDEAPWLHRVTERASLYGFDSSNSKASQFIDEGDIMEVGSIRFEILDLRGHSPAGLGFLFEGLLASDGVENKRKLIICGDALFAGSIGRTDLQGGDMELLLENIRRKIFTLPDETLVLSGHGPITTVEQEKRFNPFFGPGRFAGP
jgi:hydroxyacylglutathione hydrolase